MYYNRLYNKCKILYKAKYLFFQSLYLIALDLTCSLTLNTNQMCNAISKYEKKKIKLKIVFLSFISAHSESWFNILS